MRIFGQIYRLHPMRGYGYILTSTGEEVLLRNAYDYSVGDHIEFDVVRDRDGARAINVCRAADGGKKRLAQLAEPETDAEAGALAPPLSVSTALPEGAELTPRNPPPAPITSLPRPAPSAPVAATGNVPRYRSKAIPTGALTFDSPGPFLKWASANWDSVPTLELNLLSYTDIWSLVALASLTLPERSKRPPLDDGGQSTAARFARAVGLGALTGGPNPTLHDKSRTVRLTRIHTRAEIEPTADKMASLVISDTDDYDMRLAIKYVLVELIRNVVQHSGDSLGAVAAAQTMGGAQRRSRPMIQLAVADAGMGIPRSLRRAHPHLADDRQALERALLPHISGTFEEGLSGSFENAGLGLYMISELVRQTEGRLLIATDGATLVLQPGASGRPPTPRFLEPTGLGFPGTVVAFEIPSDSVHDYHVLMQSILRKAEERTPKRASNKWLTFEPGPSQATRLRMSDKAEDTLEAASLSLNKISPSIVNRVPVELDFAGLPLCTQSWLHALLFEPVRLGWALRVPIHVVHAEPAVQEGLRFLEAYALGG